MPSKLDQLQQQFRQRIDQRKEENLGSIRLYNESQQKVLERVSKSHLPSVSEPPGGKPTLSRRNGSGVDRSRPLKPLAGRPPLQSSHSVETAMVVGGASGRVRPTSTNAQPPVPQTRLKVQKTGAGNSRLLGKANTDPPKPPGDADSKVVSVKTTTTTFKMEQKRNGSVSQPVNGVKSATVKTVVTTSKTTDGVNGVKSATASTVRTVTTAAKTPDKKTRAPALRSPATTTTTVTKSTTTKVLPVTTVKASPIIPKTTNLTSKVQRNGPAAVRSAPSDPNLAACKICGRSFAKDRIEKHIQICEKTSTKKRRVYDAVKIRVQGTEAEKYVKKGALKENPKLTKKTNWRHQHETFISAIREAKAVQRHLEAGGKLSDLPPPVPSENPDYVQCPHCGRRFNQGVAERHIPKCKTILCNKKPVPKKK